MPRSCTHTSRARRRSHFASPLTLLALVTLALATLAPCARASGLAGRFAFESATSPTDSLESGGGVAIAECNATSAAADSILSFYSSLSPEAPLDLHTHDDHWHVTPEHPACAGLEGASEWSVDETSVAGALQRLCGDVQLRLEAVADGVVASVQRVSDGGFCRTQLHSLDADHDHEHEHEEEHEHESLLLGNFTRRADDAIRFGGGLSAQQCDGSAANSSSSGFYALLSQLSIEGHDDHFHVNPQHPLCDGVSGGWTVLLGDTLVRRCSGVWLSISGVAARNSTGSGDLPALDRGVVVSLQLDSGAFCATHLTRHGSESHDEHEHEEEEEHEHVHAASTQPRVMRRERRAKGSKAWKRAAKRVATVALATAAAAPSAPSAAAPSPRPTLRARRRSLATDDGHDHDHEEEGTTGPMLTLDGQFAFDSSASSAALVTAGGMTLDQCGGLAANSAASAGFYASLTSAAPLDIHAHGDHYHISPKHPLCVNATGGWANVGLGVMRRCEGVWIGMTPVSAREATATSGAVARGLLVHMLYDSGSLCATHLSALASAHDHEEEAAASTVDTWEMWLYSMIAIAITCVVSLSGVLLMSLCRRWVQAHMAEMLALSCGTFIGSLIFQLLPETAHELGMDVEVTAVLLGGILFGMLSETVMHNLGSLGCFNKNRRGAAAADHSHGHGHGHSHGAHAHANGDGKKALVADDDDEPPALELVTVPSASSTPEGSNGSTKLVRMHMPESEPQGEPCEQLIGGECGDEGLQCGKAAQCTDAAATDCPAQANQCITVKPCPNPCADVCPAPTPLDCGVDSVSSPVDKGVVTTPQQERAMGHPVRRHVHADEAPSTALGTASGTVALAVHDASMDEETLDKKSGHTHVDAHHGHSHGHGHGHGHGHSHGGEGGEADPVQAAIINCVADAFHNFIDGALVGATFVVSTSTGWTTTLAIILHELPQELSDFALLTHAGLSVTKAALVNFAVSLTAFLGAIIAVAVGSEFAHEVTNILPFSAGLFLYLSLTLLLPEMLRVQGRRRIAQVWFAFACGVGIMAVLLALPWKHEHGDEEGGEHAGHNH